MADAQKKPWWQMTRTPAWGFWLGGFWLAYSLLRWLVLDSSGRFAVIATCVFAVLGACFVASSVAQVRRRRAAQPEPRG